MYFEREKPTQPPLARALKAGGTIAVLLGAIFVPLEFGVVPYTRSVRCEAGSSCAASATVVFAVTLVLPLVLAILGAWWTRREERAGRLTSWPLWAATVAMLLWGLLAVRLMTGYWGLPG